MDNFMYKDQLAPPVVAQFLRLVHSNAHAFLQVGYVFFCFAWPYQFDSFRKQLCHKCNEMY